MIEGTQSSLSDLLLYEINEIPGVPMDDAREVSKGPSRNNIYKYGAGILAAGEARATSIPRPSGSVRSEPRSQRPKEPARL